MKKNRLFDLLKIHFLLAGLYFSIMGASAQDLNPTAWPHLKGYWKYQDINNLTKATVGKDLVLVGKHQTAAGPAVGDSAIRVAIGSYYTCRHGMAPNGGGDSVNQYTLMFDFKVLSFKKWHTFHKSDSNNNNDGECFIRPLSGTGAGRIGVGATGYSQDSINPNQWYRLMISVNLNHFYRYYLNGKLLHEGDTQALDGRFALTPKMIFFGDDNQEDDTIDVASVAVFDTCLSTANIAKIGSIDPCVANPPKISLGRDTTLCDYNAIVKNAGAGFKKYQWYNGSSQPSLTLTKSIGIGKKSIWCKVTDANGCTAADTFVLTYIASPVVILGADQSFCEGLNTKLTVVADTTYQYLWRYLPNGHALSLKNIIVVDSSGLYTVAVTSKIGCVNRDTIKVTVFIRPAKPEITITGNTNLCQGESVTLSGPPGFFDYAWSNGSNQQSIVSNKNETLKLKVTDNNNCTSLYSDSSVVKVFALPAKPKLVLTGNDSFCSYDSAMLTVAAGYKEYKWPDNLNAFKKNSRYVNLAGLYYVTVKDSNGCSGPPSDSIRITIQPSPGKPIIQLKGKASICQGESTQISGPSGFKGYRWTPDIRTTQIDTVSAGGTYQLEVQNTFGCNSLKSDGITIVVNAVPLKPTVLRIGQKDSLQSNKTENHYKWYRNNVLIKDTNKAINASPNNYYQVQTGNGLCWSVVSDSFIYTNSGISKLNGLAKNLWIYPNPTHGEFTLKIKDLQEEVVGIVITDMQGREVYNSRVIPSGLNAGLTISLNLFNPGIYQLSIISPAGIITGRIEKL